MSKVALHVKGKRTSLGSMDSLKQKDANHSSKRHTLYQWNQTQHPFS
jgi:hypothetical protein